MGKIVVYTCIVNDYDTLKEIRCPEDDVDYICFSNTPMKSKIWQIRLLPNPLNLDPGRLSRYPKIMPHIFLWDYDISVYIDGSIKIIGSIKDFIRKSLGDFDFCACKHPYRNCIYKEANVVKKMKDSREVVEAQMLKYKEEGFPKRFGLIAGGMMIRRHNTPMNITISTQWWDEVRNHSKRDQLSFNYVAWKNPDFKYKTIDYHSTLDGKYLKKISNHNEKYIH